MSRSTPARHPPKKSLGQHFLRNPAAADKIVAALQPAADELILEIGPGEGVLTERLIQLGNRIHAVEIDRDLAAHLRRRFPRERLTVIEGDARAISLPEEPFVAVGNLPYNVGTPILRRVIAHPSCRRAVFMVQREVARRLVAKPGDPDYGYLTLATELDARSSILLHLAPGSFTPPPKVWSSVVVLERSPAAIGCSRPLLADLLSHAFRMRRKKLLNNLEGFEGASRAAVIAAIDAAGLPANVRAERLSLEELDRLCVVLGGEHRTHGIG